MEGISTPLITKPKLPPPIVLHQQVVDHKSLITLIRDLIGKQFHLKHTMGRITIQTYNNQNYRSLLKELTENNISLHTFTPKDERTHGFVTKGLDSCPDLEEVKEDLEEINKMPIQKIFKMNTKLRPLHLIITGKNVNLTFLQENLNTFAKPGYTGR